MSEEQTYRDEMYCDHCDDDTDQIVHSDGHERDSSGDWQICLKCGYRKSGWGGGWNPFYSPEEIEKAKKEIH